jgi:hypothetical protein
VNHGIAVEEAGGHDVHGARVVGGFDFRGRLRVHGSRNRLGV